MASYKKKSSRKGIVIIVLVIVLAVAGWGGYRIYSGMQGGSRAESVMAALHSIIPGLGVDTGVATGLGRDPLAAVSVDGLDIVGVIELPAIDVTAPVAAKGTEEEFFASWLDGSPVQGHFEIVGGRDDVFRKISSLKPGDRAVFTDIDGVRYSYTVTTQYHLKKWDIGDNDLLICYQTDDDTYFVVGCTIEQ